MAASRIIGRGLAALFVVLAIAGAIAVVHRLHARPRTTDAIITANTIQVAPEIAGRIVALHVKDDAVVHAGDVLFEIEREPYELNLAQAAALVRSLEAEIDVTRRRVMSEQSGVGVARANADAARARLVETTQTLQRLEPLLAEHYVTPQAVDTARAAKATAQSQLAGAEMMIRQSREAVGDVNALVAQLDGARAAVGRAERDLRNTLVRAPFDGRVVGVTTSIGQLVSPGRALFTLIDTSQWYCEASFRETDLARIHPGERATVYVMIASGEPVQGVVESVTSAVAEPENLAIAGVPPVERELNWVRIAQRFPVRIAIEHPPDELMRIGASAVAVVFHERD